MKVDLDVIKHRSRRVKGNPPLSRRATADDPNPERPLIAVAILCRHRRSRLMGEFGSGKSGGADGVLRPQKLPINGEPRLQTKSGGPRPKEKGEGGERREAAGSGDGEKGCHERRCDGGGEGWSS